MSGARRPRGSASSGRRAERSGARSREALALVAVIASITRPNDDVIVVEQRLPWLDAALALARVRPRHARRDEVFDAIGEHTRALIASSEDAELLEALASLGPLALGIGPRSASASFAPLVEGVPLFAEVEAPIDRAALAHTFGALGLAAARSRERGESCRCSCNCNPGSEPLG